VESFLFWSLIVLVALVPLPFGSARPWSWSLYAVLVGLLLIGYGLWVVGARSARARLALGRLAVPAVLTGAALAWSVVQTLPADSGLADPAWRDAASALGTALTDRITSDVFATVTAIMIVLAHFGVFALMAEFCRSPRWAERALLVLVCATSIYALGGLLAFVLVPDRLLWFERWAYFGDLTSVFVNRNSAATFFGLGLLANVALLARYFEDTASSGAGRLNMQLLRVAAEKGWLPIIGTIACLGAVVLTHSRGGLLSTGVGLVAMVICLVAVRGRRARSRWALAGLAVAAAVVVIAVGGETTFGRFGQAVLALEQRPDVFRLTQVGIADRPLTGHGLGTFENAFRAYGDGSLNLLWERAHNDYLEAAFELGIPAAALLFLGFAYVALQCALGIRRRRRDAHYPVLATAATALVGAHALVDFSMQITAVATLYVAIVGLGYAQSWSTAGGGGSRNA
jgi:O-antigen ligase